MRSKAAVLRNRHEAFSIEELELPELKDDEVLIRIVGVGLCHTDIATRDGQLPSPLPVVLGHEGSGVVEQVGKQVHGLELGDHVVLTAASCGRCSSCLVGEPTYCLNFGIINSQSPTMIREGRDTEGRSIALKFFGQSSFAKFALANERNTIKVRKDAPLKALGPLGCGIQTGAGTVLNGLKPKPGSSIAILGCGSVGLSGLMAAVVAGCTTVIAVDVIESRLGLAKSLGATHVIDGKSKAGLEAEIRRIAPAGVNYIFDTTAIPALVREAANSLALRGHLGLVGVPRKMDETFTLDVIRNLSAGISIHNFIEGDSIPQHFIPTLVDLWMQGKFPLDKLISYYPFEKINEAIADQHKGLVTKPVLLMSPE